MLTSYIDIIFFCYFYQLKLRMLLKVKIAKLIVNHPGREKLLLAKYVVSLEEVTHGTDVWHHLPQLIDILNSIEIQSKTYPL